MKNVSSLKSNNTNSPKTPGGISKSLLTPYRRVGLSRNWRKSGPSPFISPLSGNSQVTPVVKEDKKESRKRKEPVADENGDETSEPTNDCEKEDTSENIDKTPSRNVELPRRKKSKTFISTINKSQENVVADEDVVNDTCNKVEMAEETPSVGIHNSENIEQVSTPVHSRSKMNKKRTTPVKSTSKINNTDSKPKSDDFNKNAIDTKESPAETEKSNIINKKIESETSLEQESNKDEPIYTIKEKSPNDLRKECVVVIQRKIFRNIENNRNTDIQKPNNNIEKPLESDSDSDEAPLINLQKQNSIKTAINNIMDDDNDFIDSKTTNKVKETKSNKVKDTKSPKNKVKTNKTSKVKPEKVITEPKVTSQNCFDDDQDDDFDHKKTILIRKSYDKVSKPIKAKSTGSITQRDIDNLRDRIEAKKNLLLAQTLTPETEELRTLIKKWQKGCQDALMELLDLMRNKCPDKESMDYSNMLKALKIPPSLVGYDSENDCFNSPDDASIILGPLKDL